MIELVIFISFPGCTPEYNYNDLFATRYNLVASGKKVINYVKLFLPE